MISDFIDFFEYTANLGIDFEQIADGNYSWEWSSGRSRGTYVVVLNIDTNIDWIICRDDEIQTNGTWKKIKEGDGGGYDIACVIDIPLSKFTHKINLSELKKEYQLEFRDLDVFLKLLRCENDI